MFNQTEIPSLAIPLDAQLGKLETVPGKVSDPAGRLFGNFSMASDHLASLTSDELYLLFLKPAAEALGRAVKNYADGRQLMVKALPLPGKDTGVIGWRCFQGRVPVNIYILRRKDPDRHQFIMEVHVEACDEA